MGYVPAVSGPRIVAVKCPGRASGHGKPSVATQWLGHVPNGGREVADDDRQRRAFTGLDDRRRERDVDRRRRRDARRRRRAIARSDRTPSASASRKRHASRAPLTTRRPRPTAVRQTTATLGPRWPGRRSDGQTGSAPTAASAKASSGHSRTVGRPDQGAARPARRSPARDALSDRANGRSASGSADRAAARPRRRACLRNASSPRTSRASRSRPVRR